jgi:NAD(P)-dependent dehydrogenase (short-subunit alcohol dehydrogenase family)
MKVLVVGASGGLGREFLSQLNADPRVTHSVAWSRSLVQSTSPATSSSHVDLMDEGTIAAAAAQLGEIDLAIVATGLLHSDALLPEKTWRALDPATMRRVFEINTIGPALIAKHVLPKLCRDRRAVFAALSARVGSISDNHLGGWHSYRASKAALNQVIRCLSIELAMKRPLAICVGLHPGTVDTPLSKPFHNNLKDGQLFSPAHSASQLLKVIDGLNRSHSGRVFDWAGIEVQA